MAKKTVKTANKQPVAICDQSTKPVTKRDQLMESSSPMGIKQVNIGQLIMTIRDTQVMVDRDLALLYGVDTKVLNQAVKRNISRFPERFRFQLSDVEKDELVTNCDRFKTLKHSSVAPYVFTEQGISMLSTVLRSQTAIDVSIRIMDAFVAMRHFLANNAQVFQRLANIEYHQIETDKRIEEVFKRLDANVQPQQGIFYDGQVFDAYQFVSDSVRKAKNSVVLIDNYVDETTLTMLSKRGANVSATIYTKQTAQQFQLDVQRHNQQYPPITIHACQRNHDRFLIIDNVVYLFGASLKDAGKKLFAYIQMQETSAADVLNWIR